MRDRPRYTERISAKSRHPLRHPRNYLIPLYIFLFVYLDTVVCSVSANHHPVTPIHRFPYWKPQLQ